MNFKYYIDDLSFDSATQRITVNYLNQIYCQEQENTIILTHLCGNTPFFLHSAVFVQDYCFYLSIQ